MIAAAVLLLLIASQSAALSVSENMSFGSKLDLAIRLPTRERAVAQSFIRDPHAILGATWDKDKFTRLSQSTYLLRMAPFPMLGVDTIAPEIEVTLAYEETSSLIRMTSGNWALKGTNGGVLKDSRFVKSFTIDLKGELSLREEAPATGGEPVLKAAGWVQYAVQSKKPSMFQAAPSFVLDATVRLIQDSVREFATAQFSARLLRAFRAFAMQSMRNNANANQAESKAKE